VRAAEDGRSGPLPTLEQAIVLAFGFDKASAQRACDEVKSWPEDVQKDCRFFLGDSLEQGVERLKALVEAWRYGKGLMAARYPAMIPKSVSASSAPEQENKGDGMRPPTTKTATVENDFADAAERSTTVNKTAEPQSGMRTERVTVEVTYDHGAQGHPRSWDWSTMVLDEGESVRVVEDAVGSVDDRAYADRVGCDEERDFVTRILDQRDAAIRERDAAQARVAELEAASGGGEGEPVANFTFHADDSAERARYVGMTVKPLRRPQPRGWLTQGEIAALTGCCVSSGNLNEEGKKTIRNLLARSSPPEVVLPKLHTRCEVNEANHKSPCLWFRRPDVIEALTAAGVAVKEVGRE
jgi:hypothetical protein